MDLFHRLPHGHAQNKGRLTLFQHHPSNLLLSIPVLTVLLPSSFRFPLPVPFGLVLPHLTYLTLFILSILIDLKSGLKTT